MLSLWWMESTPAISGHVRADGTRADKPSSFLLSLLLRPRCIFCDLRWSSMFPHLSSASKCAPTLILYKNGKNEIFTGIRQKKNMLNVDMRSFIKWRISRVDEESSQRSRCYCLYGNSSIRPNASGYCAQLEWASREISKRRNFGPQHKGI